MPLQVDAGAILPIGTTIIIVLAALISLQYFATKTDIANLETKLAEKYALKEDVDTGLEKLEKKLESSVNTIFTKIDELTKLIIENFKK